MRGWQHAVESVPCVTTLGVMTASLVLLGSAVPASAASAAVSIDAPVAPPAGTVNLTGSVGVEAGEVTTVLYVFDATRSTASPQGSDCSGNGAVGAEDDRNGDGSVGDILDCEIAGVEALNSQPRGDERAPGGSGGVQQPGRRGRPRSGRHGDLPATGFHRRGSAFHGSTPWPGASSGTGSASTTPGPRRQRSRDRVQQRHLRGSVHAGRPRLPDRSGSCSSPMGRQPSMTGSCSS